MADIVYLTGANGFIGKHIVSSAKEIMDVRPVARAALYSGEGELRFEPGSTVVHLAAKVHEMKGEKDGNAYLEVNKEVTVRLAQAALRSQVRQFIFFSSIKVFSDAGHGQFGATTVPKPDEPYGQSKYEAEQQLEKLFQGQSACRCVVFRLPMVYGPGNKGNMLPLLKAAARGIPLPLGATRGKRSMLYVGNIVSAVRAIVADTCSDRPPFQVYSLSDGADLTSAELYSTIFRVFRPGKSGVFYFPSAIMRAGASTFTLVERFTGVPLPFNNAMYGRLFNEFRFSGFQFGEDYGWTPPYSPAQGIAETVAWFRENAPEGGDSSR